MEGGGGAYGAGRATGHFDLSVYIRKPEVILRAVTWLLSMIVFSCISSSSADMYCEESLGVTISVIAFCGVMVFLVLDALFDNISSVQQRKYVVIADMAFSGVWTFMSLVCFSYTTHRCNYENEPPISLAISASFFSILTFAGLTYLAVKKYRKGIEEDFGVYDYETNVTPGSTPISVPGITDDTFLPTPFSSGNTQKRDGGLSQGHNGQPQGDSFPPQGDCGVPGGDTNHLHNSGESQPKNDVFNPPQ